MTAKERSFTGTQWREIGINHHQNEKGLIYYKHNHLSIPSYLKQGGSLDKIVWFKEEYGYKLEEAMSEETDNVGSIYIVINPAWSEWVKVGKHRSGPRKVESEYNRGSPFRDYECVITIPFNNYKKAEDSIHKMLENKFERNRGIRNKCEWFKCSVEEALQVIESYEE